VRQLAGLHRTVGVALATTYGLIVLGAWVRATNSGLSCPDWPTCYGHWLPLPGEIPAEAGYSYGQVMLEWLHRLIAGVLLGPLILAIAWLCWRARAAMPRLPLYGGMLILLLLVQASLGGVTVLDQNSPWSVALHLVTALVLFSLLWLIFERTGPIAAAGPGGAVRGLAVATWLLALGTMAGAAMTAKSGASLACASWPLCNGALIPDLADPLVRLHASHRWFAAGTALGVLALALATRSEPALRGLARGALVLIAAQILLGALVIVQEIALGLAILHQAVGVLTFALIARLLWRSLGPASRRPATAPAADPRPA
jgi:heme A synthase